MGLSMDYKQADAVLWDAIENEKNRQENNIELIASENFVSEAVMAAQGSVLTNKYAEGYPGKRYYGGCEFVDIVENLAIERVCDLFDAKFANVQPHSGSQANTAAYMALVNPGDTIMGMDLTAGGHLTHGSPVNFSGKTYNFVSYGVDPVTEVIDYEVVKILARKHQPKLIVAGASAYSREIDFKKFREIADSVGAKLMVDMAHIAGLVATGLHQNPMDYADIVTSTTHKTLRGPRGGVILTNDADLAKKINSNIFPGIQGGPLEHVIAAKAVAFKEVLDISWKEYAKQIKANAKVLEIVLITRGYDLVSNGTDNHLVLVSFLNKDFSGKDADLALGNAGITVNKNSVPGDTRSPFITSGIRIGSPALTARGMKEKECEFIAHKICDVLDNIQDVKLQEKINKEVEKLASKFVLYTKSTY